MILACMIGLDEDALICDLAETYHIYKFDDFDAGYIATLAAGLRDDARIVKKITGCDLSMAELLAAGKVTEAAAAALSKNPEALLARVRHGYAGGRA